MTTLFKILSISFTLFLLMDSLGNVPIFIAILKKFDANTQKKIIRRELLIALGIILSFHFFGKFLLDLIQVKQETILIAGGIILFLISLQMIFPSVSSENSPNPLFHGNPFIVPLAIPLLAGPAVLAAVMLYSDQENLLITIPAIILAWLASTAVLTSSTFLKKLLGEQGLLACEKLMGLLLTLIAIQMCLKGVNMYAVELKKLLAG